MVARSDAWVCSRSQGHPCGERRRRTTSTNWRIRSTSSATFLVAVTIGRGFDLHQPFGVEQAAHPDQRGHGLDRAKDFGVRPANLAPAARHRREDAGPCHIVEAGAHPGKRLADDPQTLPRLLVDVPLAHRGSVIGGRGAAADLDRRTNPHRARIADDPLPLAAGGENLAIHAGTGEVQNAQRCAAIGITLRHSGHFRVLGSPGGSWRNRAINRLSGRTTKKKTAMATSTKARTALKKSP